MHILNKKDLSSDEMETLSRSTNPTTVVFVDRESAIKRGSTRISSRSWSLRDGANTRWWHACSSIIWKTLRKNGYFHEWASGQKPRLTKEGPTIICKTDNFVPLVVPPVLKAFRFQHVEKRSGNSLWKQSAIRFKFIFRSSTRSCHSMDSKMSV